VENHPIDYLIAEDKCPSDIKEWGKNHGIPEFAKFTWQTGYLAGIKEAMKAQYIHSVMLQRIDQLMGAKTPDDMLELSALADACVAYEKIMFPMEGRNNSKNNEYRDDGYGEWGGE
jgi:hypothetical protein